jgi:hypothetical protein
MKLDCRKLKELFEVEEGPDYIEFDVDLGPSKSAGILNSFYGKKHTDETKKILREKTLNLLKDHEFRMSRANYGEKNGMYGSSRTGELNPMYGKKQSQETKSKISKKANLRYKNGFINPNKGKILTEEQKKVISENNSKLYKIKTPSGELIEIKNMTEYCKKNNLNPIMMSRVSRGIAKKHKGYTTP